MTSVWQRARDHSSLTTPPCARSRRPAHKPAAGTGDPLLLLAAIGVGVSSSVIPYVCDQLAMARLPRATFALLLALLPATATAIGFLVLRQVPTAAELLGIALVISGVALHQAEA